MDKLLEYLWYVVPCVWRCWRRSVLDWWQGHGWRLRRFWCRLWAGVKDFAVDVLWAVVGVAVVLAAWAVALAFCPRPG